MIDDTIIAIGTAPGESGIGIIRLSGNKAIGILDALFLSKTYKSAHDIPRRYMAYGHIIDEHGKKIDEVLAVIMKAPYSYTAEDVVEIHCHGGIIPVKRIMNLALKKGARLAEAGEFTKRAFLNGRIDLSQAEAVIDMITAKTDGSLENALEQLEGSLSMKIKAIIDILLESISKIEASIDFPEHDIEEVTLESVKNSITEAKQRIDSLLDTYEEGKIQKDGLNTAIIGRPNVGKSSLLNVLLKENRAIVTDIPGTTRDVIEEYLNLEGILLKLVDTAGLRETEDLVEKIGVERTRKAILNADLIIFIIDASESLKKEDWDIINILKNKNVILLVNKIDKEMVIEIQEIEEIFDKKNIIKTSIKDHKGIEDLHRAIVDMVYKGKVTSKNSFLLSNVRHKSLLTNASDILDKALEAADSNIPVDLLSVFIKDAYDSLGEITGDLVDEDILEAIFNRFCIGK